VEFGTLFGGNILDEDFIRDFIDLNFMTKKIFLDFLFKLLNFSRFADIKIYLLRKT
jgi:hypothetical protein